MGVRQRNFWWSHRSGYIYRRWTLTEKHSLNSTPWLILLSFIVVFSFRISLLSHSISSPPLCFLFFCCFLAICLCHPNTHTSCTSLIDSYRSRFSTKTLFNCAFYNKTTLIAIAVKTRNVAYYVAHYAVNNFSCKTTTRIFLLQKYR